MASSIVEEIEVDLVTGMASRIAASVDEIGDKGLASKRIARREVLRRFVRTMLYLVRFEAARKERSFSVVKLRLVVR
jgi:hypothetical protein